MSEGKIQKSRERDERRGEGEWEERDVNEEEKKENAPLSTSLQLK